MRPGITIQHAREEKKDTGYVRSDIAGFIGVVPRGRWPSRAIRGDFFEMRLTSYAALLSSPARVFFDPVTRRAVRAFFDNGGAECRLFGLCIESQEDLMGDDPFSTVFHALLERLRAEEDIALLAMPALAYLPIEFLSGGRVHVPWQPILEMLLLHCREMNNRFLVIDSPRDLHEKPLMKWVETFRDQNRKTSCFGAFYYPWVYKGDEIFPPSGSVLGVYARADLENQPFGVRWPPANQVIRGVTHPAVPISWQECGDLNVQGINVLITQPGRGVVVWGARTLSKDPKWLHINSRRIVSFIAEQLRRDSEWVVFEHQRPELWDIINRMVEGRLNALWSAGLLAGDKAGSEYSVQCDAQTNPVELRESGQVNVNIVLRPISTAESIVVELRLGADHVLIGGD